jgi:hypothetical protein
MIRSLLHWSLVPFFGFFSFCSGIAQFDSLHSVNDQIEWIAERQDFVPSEQSVLEAYPDIIDKPVSINQMREQEYLRIPFLSSSQRTSLMNYVKQFGDVLSIYELLVIPGFDSSLVMKIAPFISLEPSPEYPKSTVRNLLRLSHHKILLRYNQVFPSSEGYRLSGIDGAGTPEYVGSPHRYKFRYEWNYFNFLRIGFIGEKDPGEQFFRGNQSYGMDEYGGYISMNGRTWLKNLTVGAYRAGFGEGIVLGGTGGWMTSPGMNAQAFRNAGIRPSLAINDPFTFRGIAAVIKTGSLEISPFISYRKRDSHVSITDSLTGEPAVISRFIDGGYHRNAEEIEAKKNVSEWIVGGNLTFSGNWFRAGLTALWTHWSVFLEPGNEPYRKFTFRGNECLAGGLDLRFRFKGCYLFGEVAVSMNGGIAGLAGIEFTFPRSSRLMILYRNYRPEYQNLFSNSFGQNSLTANEEGVFARINTYLSRGKFLSACLDLFRFPWLKYRVDAPSVGYEATVSIGSSPEVLWSWQILYFHGTRMTNYREPADHLNKLTITSCDGIRIQGGWAPLKSITLRSRIDLRQSTTQGMKAKGYLFSQHIRYTFSGWPAQCLMQFFFFDIPEWEARIWSNEPDVTSGFSLPVFQGKGSRYGILFKVPLSRYLDLNLRGFMTRYQDRNVIGSGADAIHGNIKAEVTVQLVVQI